MMILAFGFLNLKPDEFWEYTIAELQIMVKGFEERQELQRKNDLWFAWHLESLHRQKRLPKLKSVLSGNKEAKVLEGEELDVRRKEFDEMKQRHKSRTK